MNRRIHVINLDPAAEQFDYPCLAGNIEWIFSIVFDRTKDPLRSDIRDLISLDDVTDDAELHFGPNGGLVYCMEYLVDNLDWLEESLGEVEDDYILFDCPGKWK